MDCVCISDIFKLDRICLSCSEHGGALFWKKSSNLMAWLFFDSIHSILGTTLRFFSLFLLPLRTNTIVKLLSSWHGPPAISLSLSFSMVLLTSTSHFVLKFCPFLVNSEPLVSRFVCDFVGSHFLMLGLTSLRLVHPLSSLFFCCFLMLSTQLS